MAFTTLRLNSLILLSTFCILVCILSIFFQLALLFSTIISVWIFFCSFFFFFFISMSILVFSSFSSSVRPIVLIHKYFAALDYLIWISGWWLGAWAREFTGGWGLSTTVDRENTLELTIRISWLWANSGGKKWHSLDDCSYFKSPSGHVLSVRVWFAC